ncbi:MAG: hypothetical protein HN623_08755, partial [Bdellovibrionales bacterium]|nr:hypothetical protein [Bdellovibrionales bacterium]
MAALVLASCATSQRRLSDQGPRVNIQSANLPPTLEIDHHTLAKLGARVDQVISSKDQNAIKFLGDDLFFKAYDASVRGEAGLA